MCIVMSDESWGVCVEPPPSPMCRTSIERKTVREGTRFDLVFRVVLV